MHATRFVESYFDAWNHGDPKGVADHLTADGIYRDIPENVQRTHDELPKTLSEFFSKIRHRYELVGDILTNRNTLAFQYRIYPQSNTDDAGSASPVNGAEFMMLNGDAAISITDYYDSPDVTLPSKLANSALLQAQQTKYAKSGLSAEQLLEYKNRLEHIVRVKQAYLRPELTLPKLADVVNCSVNHLSQVINSGFGMSFFDYLNQHRIEHAKVLLKNIDDHNLAILSIAFTVGFNSNSAFYSAFKKCVGQTPAQFRRAQQHKPH
jgi:AraC-like DNA-binding protein/nuclear transport factor 2 (NTF2) superfamily protein